MRKYRNKKTVVDGITFDSKKEAERYKQLKRMQEAGDISDLELQPEFVIAERVKLDGKTKRQRKYRADFRYLQSGEVVVEDVKGFKTEMYKLKRHLVKERHGVEVKEI